MALGQFQHVAKCRHIGTSPRITADEAGNNVGDAQQPQRPAGQGAYGALWDDGGSGLVHAAAIRGFSSRINANKKAARLPGLPYCGKTLAYLAAVLPKRLRNFSTRPPMLSPDFCVPV